MRTAVIGANGFLGREIVDFLLGLNKEVLGVYNKNRQKIPPRAEVVSMQEFLEGKADVKNIIFSAGNFKKSVEENITLNCEVLYKLTKVYKNCRFLYISSANVYGNSGNVVSETSPFFNPNPYAQSKLTGEFITSGLNSFAIVRLVYLYGSHLENGSFLPFIVEKAKKEGVIPLFGKGEREQDYLHVEDAARLCVKALFDGGNSVFLGATGSSFSNFEVAKIVKQNLGSPCEIKFLPQSDNASSLYYNPSWTCEQLDWKPQISLEKGIKDLVK